MKINSRDLDSLREFFEEHRGLTNNQLAIIADAATCTIVDWKRKCGVIESNYKKPPKKAKGPIPKDWDNKEWFEKAYEEMGLQAIALLLGKGNDWKFVARRLKKYGIPRKTHEERVMSQNPCCDEGWLHYYYADREDYLAWCNKQGIEPCPEGGQRLSTVECAKLADVSDYTISNWLSTHKMKIRTRAEANCKPANREKTIAERRNSRDKFFENYRNGTINIIIGSNRFSNGRRVDQEEIINKRFNRKLRGTSKHPTSSEEG